MPMWLTTASSQSGTRLGGGGLWGAHAASLPSGVGYRFGAHGRGAGPHRACIPGGETGAAERRRGRGLAPVARACVPAGAGEIAPVSGEDSRRSVAEERSRPSGRLRAEELDRIDALP